MRLFFAVSVLVVAVVAAYTNTFRVPFVLDDAATIFENPTTASLRTALFPPGDSGLTSSGRPLVNFTLALNRFTSGKSVWSYHVFNLAVHLAATLAFFGLLRRTLRLPVLRERFGASADGLALAAAAVWALHPLQTESVTYIVQRAESLVALFYFLTLYGLARALECASESGDRRGRLWLSASATACLLGMASKEVMVSAPLAALMFDRLFGAGAFGAALRMRPRYFAALAGTWILLAVCVVSTGGRGGTVGFTETVPAFHYALTQCHAVVLYLRLVFWPDPLVLDYGRFLISDWREVAVEGAILVGLVGAALWAWRRAYPAAFTGLLFFAVLAPTSSFVPVVTQTMAEHRMYLALAPVVALCVLGAHRWIGARVWPVWLMIAGVLGVVTWQRNQVYGSAVSIWTDTAKKAPYSTRAWICLSKALSDAGRAREARSAIDQAILADPRDVEARLNSGHLFAAAREFGPAAENYREALMLAPDNYDAHYALGLVLVEDGHTAEALTHFQSALVAKPASSEAAYNLGNALVSLGRAAEAVPLYEKAIASDPNSAKARNNLANTLLGLGRAGEAVPVLREGLRRAPRSVELATSLGLVWMSLQRLPEAISQFEALLARDAGLAGVHANLGLAHATAGDVAKGCEHYARALALEDKARSPRTELALRVSLAEGLVSLGRAAEALPHHRRAAELAPDNGFVQHALARAYLESGDFVAAAERGERAVRLEPGLAEAHRDLGVAFAALGRGDRARRALEAALKLKPDDAEAAARLRALDGGEIPLPAK